MIAYSEMFAQLLKADPTFEPIWGKFCREWQDDPQPPLYLALGDLAAHLIAKLEMGSTESFDLIFDVIEQWHVEGDSYVREAATVGLLEDLQNLNLHKTTRPSGFERWLGPKTSQRWADVTSFWSAPNAIADPD